MVYTSACALIVCSGVLARATTGSIGGFVQVPSQTFPLRMDLCCSFYRASQLFDSGWYAVSSCVATASCSLSLVPSPFVHTQGVVNNSRMTQTVQWLLLWGRGWTHQQCRPVFLLKQLYLVAKPQCLNYHCSSLFSWCLNTSGSSSIGHCHTVLTLGFTGTSDMDCWDCVHQISLITNEEHSSIHSHLG